MDDIGNIKTEKGNWYKVFWNKLTHAVGFKNRPDDGITHIAPTAHNEYDAKKFAKGEADKIENLKN